MWSERDLRRDTHGAKQSRTTSTRRDGANEYEAKCKRRVRGEKAGRRGCNKNANEQETRRHEDENKKVEKREERRRR
jgi:hypothetical protein